MMKRLCVSIVVLAISTHAATIVLAKGPAGQAKEKAAKRHFLDLLPVGGFVTLRGSGNSSVVHVTLVGIPKKNETRNILRVKDRGADYVTLVRDDRVLHLPLHSIGSISARLRDPLSKLVTGSFRRMPLLEFVGVIAKTAGIEIRIDGDALKNSGYTKNMPQTVTAEKIPAEHLLAGLCKRYPNLVLTKPGTHYLLTTRQFAKNRGEAIRELKPAEGTP